MSAPPFRTVLFDCDSTLCAIEGIEELAAEHREEMARLTDMAMRGDVPLEQVYGRRLAVLRPSRRAVERVGQMYVEQLVPDAREVVAALQGAGVDVGIVSGGLRPAVLVVAAALGIPATRVRAVEVEFAPDGAYVGYDTASPLARAMGKRDLIARWRGLPRPVLLVGDGSTDLEAADAVDAFVAYAGVVDRARVTANARTVIRSASLAPVLPLALGAPPADAAERRLYERGARLLFNA